METIWSLLGSVALSVGANGGSAVQPKTNKDEYGGFPDKRTQRGEWQSWRNRGEPMIASASVTRQDDDDDKQDDTKEERHGRQQEQRHGAAGRVVLACGG